MRIKTRIQRLEARIGPNAREVMAVVVDGLPSVEIVCAGVILKRYIGVALDGVEFARTRSIGKRLERLESGGKLADWRSALDVILDGTEPPPGSARIPLWVIDKILQENE